MEGGGSLWCLRVYLGEDAIVVGEVSKVAAQ